MRVFGLSQCHRQKTVDMGLGRTATETCRPQVLLQQCFNEPV